MDGISREIFTALKAMGKAKKPEERVMHSETVKNLCDSLGVFLQLLNDMVSYDDDDDIPVPF